MDVTRGAKFAAIIQMLILQSDVIPDEATTLNVGKAKVLGDGARGAGISEPSLARVCDEDSPRDLEDARTGLDVVGCD